MTDETRKHRERLARLEELFGIDPMTPTPSNTIRDGENFDAFLDRKVTEVLAPLGLTFDQFTDAIPLWHSGPGGCNGVDQHETYGEIARVIAFIVAKVRKEAADYLRAYCASLKGKSIYHPEHHFSPLADDIERGEYHNDRTGIR